MSASEVTASEAGRLAEALSNAKRSLGAETEKSRHLQAEVAALTLAGERVLLERDRSRGEVATLQRAATAQQEEAKAAQLALQRQAGEKHKLSEALAAAAKEGEGLTAALELAKNEAAAAGKVSQALLLLPCPAVLLEFTPLLLPPLPPSRRRPVSSSARLVVGMCPLGWFGQSLRTEAVALASDLAAAQASLVAEVRAGKEAEAASEASKVEARAERLAHGEALEALKEGHARDLKLGRQAVSSLEQEVGRLKSAALSDAAARAQDRDEAQRYEDQHERKKKKEK
jgi:hypothetical protein